MQDRPRGSGIHFLLYLNCITGMYEDNTSLENIGRINFGSPSIDRSINMRNQDFN